MIESPDAQAMALERSCALSAVALSAQRRSGVRLVSGRHRDFGLSALLDTIYVPYPLPLREWSRHTLTCGIALQCAPSKERVTDYRLNELTARELSALTLVEGQVAVAWVAGRWPGLMTEIDRLVGDVDRADPDLDARQMFDRALAIARRPGTLLIDPLFGHLPRAYTVPRSLPDKLRRSFGRLPWTTNQKRSPQPHSAPAGGDGGVRNPNLPPPSRPHENDADVTPDHRPGIPYPEWNMWTEDFMSDHVAVLEEHRTAAARPPATIAVDVRRWFQQNTYRSSQSHLEDGTDIEIDQYVEHFVDEVTGHASEPRYFRELRPTDRDVTTALLLDGSSSLGVHGGALFRLELACADALSRAMTDTRQRHGIFSFTGNTRHRVRVDCLKDFSDRRFIPPSGLGLTVGGYTRLGAPLRHLTSRLLAQPSERRLLIILGDGLICDEGYEGRYAWADVAHAVDEAAHAGVSLYYIGIGTVRVDPLPEVFGPRRYRRIQRMDDLPRTLAHVHRELVAA